MQQEIFEKRQQIFDEEHPDIIMTMHNLINTISNQGKLDEAASMQQKMLEKSRRIFDNEHSNIISTMNNFVNIFFDQDELNKTATMLQIVFNKRRRMFDNDYFDIIIAMNNLIITLCKKRESISNRNISNRPQRIVNVQKKKQQSSVQESQICTILKVFCQELLKIFQKIMSLNS